MTAQTLTRPASTRTQADKSSVIARHRAETEQAIMAVRFDATLDDRERGRRITEIVADANGRMWAMRSR